MANPNKKGKLTDKQQRFVDEYMIDLNATQACIRAGYSEKTADRIGPELLGKTWISDEIAKRKEKRAKKLETDAEWLLKRLREEADADISQIYDEKGNLKSIHDWPLIFRQGLVQGIDTATLGQDGPVTVDKIKMADRNKKLELIGRHVNVQAFKDTEDKNVIHSFEGKVSEELLKLITGT